MSKQTSILENENQTEEKIFLPITPAEEYPKLAKAVGVERLFLKREDLHPYGSQKGRSIPYMIDWYIKDGVKDFAISSSGNAGISAGLHIQKLNKEAKGKISLTIFIGENIEKQKEKKINSLTDENIEVRKVERPAQALIEMTQSGKVQSLRQSTNNIALIGYFDLGWEIAQIENVKAVFVASSSGTTSEGIATGLFQKHSYISHHIVQTSSCHPIADFINKAGEASEEKSIADAIVDKVGHRKERVKLFVKKSRGGAWVVTNKEIEDAQKLVEEKTGLKLSPNGVLPIAGLIQAMKSGKTPIGSVCCVVGGR